MYKKQCNILDWKLNIKGRPERICTIGRSRCAYIDEQQACPLFVPVPVKRRKKYTRPVSNSSWFKTGHK
jgi:hypothetical protein